MSTDVLHGGSGRRFSTKVRRLLRKRTLVENLRAEPSSRTPVKNPRQEPPSILLFRSGRHLDTAVRALQQRYPDCGVTVVAQPGIERLGIPPERCLVYGDTPFFTPRAFRRSAAGRLAASRRFDVVAVLWGGPEGIGFENVSRTALTMSPTGFVAITPDGTVIDRPLVAIAGHECRRAVASIAAAILIGVFLLLPARILRLCHR